MRGKAGARLVDQAWRRPGLRELVTIPSTSRHRCCCRKAHFHLHGELKKFFVLVEEKVTRSRGNLPRSGVNPTTVWRVTIKRLPVDSLHVAGGQQVNRCAVLVHGYD
jgi:hypothetical protein